MSDVNPRVLIVEDTPQWQDVILRCELLKRMKERDPESVIVVENYQAAESQLNSRDFALAITDVLLEEGGGRYDWRSLARLLQQQRVPIVVVSGHLNLDLALEMLNEYGVASAFKKTEFDPVKLEAHLRSILGAKGSKLDLATTRKDVTWLHLSDMHFGSADPYDRNKVIEPLWKDIDICGGRGLHPDFVMVTGDIAYGGKLGEYDLAVQFFDSLLAQTGLSKERLFVVPGNHDVDRAQIASMTQKPNLLKDRKSVRGVLEHSHSRSLYMDRLSGYGSFVASYFADCIDPLVFDSDRYYYVRTLTINDWRVAVLGLNSAWASGSLCVDGEVVDKGQLVVGERQLADALSAAGDAQVKIAAMHHPLSYLRDFDAQDLGPLLSQGCHFLLHGHLHETDVERKATLRGNMVTIPCGAVYQNSELVNSYNYVTLDFERFKARAVFRRYSAAQRAWLKDLDATGEARDGEETFDFQL